MNSSEVRKMETISNTLSRPMTMRAQSITVIEEETINNERKIKVTPSEIMQEINGDQHTAERDAVNEGVPYGLENEILYSDVNKTMDTWLPGFDKSWPKRSMSVDPIRTNLIFDLSRLNPSVKGKLSLNSAPNPEGDRKSEDGLGIHENGRISSFSAKLGNTRTVYKGSEDYSGAYDSTDYSSSSIVTERTRSKKFMQYLISYIGYRAIFFSLLPLFLPLQFTDTICRTLFNLFNKIY